MLVPFLVPSPPPGIDDTTFTPGPANFAPALENPATRNGRALRQSPQGLPPKESLPSRPDRPPPGRMVTARSGRSRSPRRLRSARRPECRARAEQIAELLEEPHVVDQYPHGRRGRLRRVHPLRRQLFAEPNKVHAQRDGDDVGPVLYSPVDGGEQGSRRTRRSVLALYR